MTLVPNTAELLARARVDLRAGLPVVLKNSARTILVGAAETVDAERLADFRALGEPVLTITRRRAETLKARCYDGQIARLGVPGDTDISWIKAIADPADDLRAPMKGPLTALRGGDVVRYEAAISLIKQARLMPAALVLEITDNDDFSR
jgi:GTP cyclohydrolase II